MPRWQAIRPSFRRVSEGMRIGLTGATGFLGRAVALTAAAQGHQVIGFSRRAGVAVDGVAEVREWNPRGAPDLADCEAVIHLAGESIMKPWTQANREAIRSSRLDGTRHLVQAIGAGPSRPAALVCASAVGYYGDRGDEVLTESSRPGTGFLAELTQQWEAEAARARSFGVRVASPRIGVVLGPQGGAWPLLRRVFSLGLGGRLGSGRQWMPWIHLHDATSLLLAAATNPSCDGPCNLVSPNPVTNQDLTREVARSLRRPALFPVPEIVLRTLLRDQARLFLDSQRAIPERASELGYTFSFPDLAGALADLQKQRPGVSGK
jgi:uncharacterized protein (TIGR01777 family)